MLPYTVSDINLHFSYLILRIPEEKKYIIYFFPNSQSKLSQDVAQGDAQ